MATVLKSQQVASFQESLQRFLDNRAVLSVVFMLPAAALLLVFLTYPLGLGIWLLTVAFAGGGGGGHTTEAAQPNPPAKQQSLAPPPAPKG